MGTNTDFTGAIRITPCVEGAAGYQTQAIHGHSAYEAQCEDAPYAVS